MSNVQQIIKRNAYAFTAGLFALAAILPSVVTVQPVSAEALLANRQITMSNPNKGATGVSYEVSFEAATAGSIQGIVVEYCALSPIINSTTCEAPDGFSVGTSSVTVDTGDSELTDTWTAASGGTSNNRLTLTKAAGDTLTLNGDVIFSTSGYTNPNDTDEDTFYARILTFADDDHATAYVTGTLTNVIDAGGVALSTADNIGVTATVQETLTFCVSGASPTASCGGVTSADIVLGSGTPPVLRVNAPDDASVFFQISTNAIHGATVRLKGDTLKSGGNIIDAIGSTPSALDEPANAGFGFRITDTGVTPATNASGTVSGIAPYNDADDWAMDLTKTTSTYGDEVASSAGPVYSVNKAINFGAKAGGTTPAGAYTTNLSLVAVGKY